MNMLALLGLVGLSQAAIVMVGDVAFDTAKMAEKINANLDQCYTPEEGEENAQAYDGDCGCALDKGEFCFSFDFTDPDYPEDGSEEDFRCAQLSQTCDSGETPDAEGGDEGGDDAAGDPADAEKFRKWHAFCCFWATQGKCTATENKAYMVTVCQEACGTVGCRHEEMEGENCQPKPTQCNKESAPVMPSAEETSVAPEATTAASAAETTVAGADTTAAAAATTAAAGAQTTQNPAVVGQPSNGQGNAGNGVVGNPTGANPATGNTGMGGACADRDQRCLFWASIDECTKNPRWMLPNCRKACRQC